LADHHRRRRTVSLRGSLYKSKWPDRRVNSTNCNMLLICLNQPINAPNEVLHYLHILSSNLFTRLRIISEIDRFPRFGELSR